MRTLHQIEIKSSTGNEYKTTITLMTIENVVFYEMVETNNRGAINKFEMRFETYKNALKQFLEDVVEYANHTALMNI